MASQSKEGDPRSANRSGEPAGEPTHLVEHFFRHESANLVTVLTRAFGLARLELVEDKVQEAMITAVLTWRQKGAPDNPAGWIHRVAKNKILDSLRSEKAHQRALSLSHQSEEATVLLIDEWLTEERLPDSLLRMMFVCCHPLLDRGSQIAITLKILGGFSVVEVARALLISDEAAKKRVQRAKTALSDAEIAVELPETAQLQDRLEAVHAVLYLMFNEGYSTSHGHEPLRDDVCEEAARLCHLLCTHDKLSTPESRALLALMLFHSARLESRVDPSGAAILLEDQDRGLWDRKLIQMGEVWLQRSRTERPSRFHLEAAIALAHCSAPSVAETNWDLIVRLYDRLVHLLNSPVYILNRAIARGEAGDPATALKELNEIRDRREMRRYPLLDAAEGRIHTLLGDIPRAREALERALHAEPEGHQRVLLERKLAELSN